MAVERFRSIEEMNAAPVRGGSPDAFERFIRHCARYRSLAPRPRPRGVFKSGAWKRRSGLACPAFRVLSNGLSSRSDVGFD